MHEAGKFREIVRLRLNQPDMESRRRIGELRAGGMVASLVSIIRTALRRWFQIGASKV
jgi:hypothetical protein